MPEYRISAGLIPFYRSSNTKTEYLLLHYPQGHWGFPKGHLEDQETLLQAAQRELAEETGLEDVSIQDEFEECVHYQYKHDDSIIQKSVHFFAGEVDEKSIELSHEHEDYQWGNQDNTFELITFQNEIDLLEAWIDFNR